MTRKSRIAKLEKANDALINLDPMVDLINRPISELTDTERALVGWEFFGIETLEEFDVMIAELLAIDAEKGRSVDMQ